MDAEWEEEWQGPIFGVHVGLDPQPLGPPPRTSADQPRPFFTVPGMVEYHSRQPADIPSFPTRVNDGCDAMPASWNVPNCGV